LHLRAEAKKRATEYGQQPTKCPATRDRSAADRGEYRQAAGVPEE